MVCWLLAMCFKFAENQHPWSQDRGTPRVPLQRLPLVRVRTHQVRNPLLLWAGRGGEVQSPTWGTVWSIPQQNLHWNTQHTHVYAYLVQRGNIFWLRSNWTGTSVKLLLLFVYFSQAGLAEICCYVTLNRCLCDLSVIFDSLHLCFISAL